MLVPWIVSKIAAKNLVFSIKNSIVFQWWLIKGLNIYNVKVAESKMGELWSHEASVHKRINRDSIIRH